jgi:DNA (cytosine-5)-methyltransferase 1
MNFKLGELFCGPGGIGYAAVNTKAVSNNGTEYSISHAWATDYDKDTCQTYIKNICPDSPESVICNDIRKLDFNRLAKISEIDGLAFGFPCNDFSMVGKQKGIDGTFGPLYSYGVQALKKFQPRWFLAENVGGLRNSNEGNTFNIILKELKEACYNITYNYLQLLTAKPI